MRGEHRGAAGGLGRESFLFLRRLLLLLKGLHVLVAARQVIRCAIHAKRLAFGAMPCNTHCFLEKSKVMPIVRQKLDPIQMLVNSFKKNLGAGG